tara:strand:- start:786 stop:2111 length:1326 start_codon:yes stop_codon:yes gene_type:complete
MKLIVIDILNYILPLNYFIFFKNINADLVVIREMGPYKFLIYLIFILFFLMYLIFKNKELIFKKIKSHNISTNILIGKNSIYFYLIFLVSFFAISYSYEAYVENPNIFYDPTTIKNIFNFYIYLSLFFFTNIVFYFLTRQLIGNRLISFITTIFWMISSIHLANLYPSLFRDYFKAIFFLTNYIFIIFFLKNKIKDINIQLVWLSLFFVCVSFIFKSDIKMLIPVYLYSLVVAFDFKIKKNFKLLIIFILISSFFAYLTSSVYDGRTFQRFGASMSNEFFLLGKSSVGPADDGLFFYNSCAYFGCNLFKAFFVSSIYEFNLIFLKFISICNQIIFLPFKYGIMFEDSNLLGKILNFKFFIFNLVYKLKFLYLILLFTFLLKIFKNKHYFSINLILILCYFALIFTLQNQIRHYFYLEGISLIMFTVILLEIYKLLKKNKSI